MPIQRVKLANGQYRYVQVGEDNKPTEFDESTGKFKMYSSPNATGDFTWGWKNTDTGDTSGYMGPTITVTGNPNRKVGIQREQDDHWAALDRDKKVDEQVNQTVGSADNFTPWGLGGQAINYGFEKVSELLPEKANQGLSYMRFLSPSYWVDRMSGISDDQLMNGEGQLFGTGTGTIFDFTTAPTIMKKAGQGIKKGYNWYENTRPRVTTDFDKIYAPNEWIANVVQKANKDGGSVFVGRSNAKLFPRNSETPTRSVGAIKDLFETTKKRFSDYYHSNEFKQRALKAGFTEEEFPQLMSEIEERINNTEFDDGFLKSNEDYGQNRTYRKADGSSPTTHKIRINSHIMDEEKMVETMWHELAHSIGGSGAAETSRYPMLSKLRNYNNSNVPGSSSGLFNNLMNNPNQVLEHLKKAFSEKINQGKLPNLYPKFFKDSNVTLAKHLQEGIREKPHEIRSRMADALDWLRRKGYNTEEFIEHPEKFTEIIDNLQKTGAEGHAGLNQLLSIFGNSKALANYSGKMLSGTGATLLVGSQMDN